MHGDWRARSRHSHIRLAAWRRARLALLSAELRAGERASAFPFPGYRSYGNDKRDVASNGRWPATYLRDVHTPSMLTESSPRHSRGAHVHTQKRCFVPLLVARTVIRAYSSHLTYVHCEPTRSVHISLVYGVFREICINAFAFSLLADEFPCNSRAAKHLRFIFICHSFVLHFQPMTALIIEIILNNMFIFDI